MKKRISIIFLSLLILISCSSIDNLTGPIKIINFNLWHGMNLDSLIMFSEYETPEIRKQRLENFLKAAEKIDPDIITLQECNKLPGIAKKIAKKLNMDEIHKIDNGGVKIFIGPPFNLKSGLTILARKGLGLKNVTSFKLPGSGIGFTSDIISMQFTEMRFVLFGSFVKNNTRFIIANTHLHHGLEVTEELKNDLSALLNSKKITKEDYEKYIEDLKIDGPIYRMKQITAIIDYFDKEHANQPFLLCGDLNASPNTEEVIFIKELGFKECQNGNYRDTWDLKNSNAQFSTNFTLPIIYNNDDVNKVLKKHYIFDTTLDYIFLKEESGSLNFYDTSLFLDKPINGLYSSDHYGITTVIK